MKRFVVVGQNKNVMCVFLLNVRNDIECIDMVKKLFQVREWGDPDISNFIEVTDAEKINIASNDDEVCQYFGIDGVVAQYDEMSFG